VTTNCALTSFCFVNMNDCMSWDNFAFRGVPETIRLANKLLTSSTPVFASSVCGALEMVVEDIPYNLCRDPNDDESVCGVLAPPVNEHGMMTGAFRVRMLPGAEVHLQLSDVFLTPQGPATVERLLWEIKRFVNKHASIVRVSVIANQSLVTRELFGTYSFSAFDQLAWAHGFLPMSAGRAASCHYASNEHIIMTRSTAMVLHRLGVPADVQQLVFSYIPCVEYARIIATRVSRKRARDDADDKNAAV